jgi:hypothetical protein
VDGSLALVRIPPFPSSFHGPSEYPFVTTARPRVGGGFLRCSQPASSRRKTCGRGVAALPTEKLCCASLGCIIIISIPIHPIMPLKLEISYSYTPYPSSCLLSSALSYSPGCCLIGLYCTSALNVVAAGYMVLYADFGEREHVFSPVRRHAFLKPSSVSP